MNQCMGAEVGRGKKSQVGTVHSHLPVLGAASEDDPEPRWLTTEMGFAASCLTHHLGADRTRPIWQLDGGRSA